MGNEAALADAQYINLRSYKKDGNPVDTPVWFALVEQRVMVFTDGTSFKVKRIRRNPKVQVARCKARGELLGPWLDAHARVLESERELIDRAYDGLNRKYGLLMRLGTLFSTLAGRVGRRVILEIALDA